MRSLHRSIAALGLIALARFIAAPRRFYVAALIASVAIDVDHIPPYLLYLGLLGSQDQRPVTRSLPSVAVFVVAAAASRSHRAVLAGVATGLILHFARGIAEGYPGCRSSGRGPILRLPARRDPALRYRHGAVMRGTAGSCSASADFLATDRPTR